MAGIDDLKAAVADVGTKVDGLTTAITAEIQVVEAVIAKLKAGSLSDADAEALAQQLTGVSTNLSTATQALSDETTKLQGQ